MKNAGATMTGALLMLATGEAAKSRAQFSEASKKFQDALGHEADRHEVAKIEEDLIEKLAAAYKSYTASATAFLALPETGPTWKTDASHLGQQTGNLLDLVDQLSLAHEQVIASGNDSSSKDIHNTIFLLRTMMVVALIATTLAYFGLSQGLLRPLQSLTTSIKKIGEGNLDQTVPVASHDETRRTRAFLQPDGPSSCGSTKPTRRWNCCASTRRSVRPSPRSPTRSLCSTPRARLSFATRRATSSH